MKKLMMSLLAVLLCGIAFCWADATVTGDVTCVPSGGGQPSNIGLTGTITLWQNDAATTYTSSVNGGSYTIENVPEGTYTAKFEGNFQGSECAGDNRCIINSGETSVTCNITAQLTTTTTTVTMPVEVGYEYEYYGSMAFNGIANATVTVKEGENIIGTGTTESTWSSTVKINGISKDKTYTIIVAATGYKTKTMTDVQGTDQKIRVLMEEQFVTLSGTLKVKVGENGTETALTALPEGMTLTVGANGTGYTAEISETGYTVQCKSGEVKVGVVDQLGGTYESAFSKNLADNYTVSMPENGSFTIADGETATQNIVLTKTAANVMGVDKSDKLLDNELTLTKPGTGDDAEDVVYKASFLASPYPNNHFRFNNVEPGTYTLACTKFGYKLKDGIATTVTVAENLADVTLPEIDIEELDEAECAFTGTLYYYGADYSYIYVENATVALYPKGETTGEPLATATSDAQGKYTVKVTGKVNTQYTLKITHASIIPIEQNVTAKNATNNVDGTVYALLASGTVTYAGDIVDGKIQLFTATGDNAYATCTFDKETGAYTIAKSSLVSGNHTIKFAGQDEDKFVLAASEEVDLTNAPVTKNLTAVKDENKGYMTIRLRYKNDKGKVFPISQQQFTFDDDNYSYTDVDGNYVSESPVEKGSTHTIALSKNERDGYDAVSLDVNGFVEINGKMKPNDTIIYVPGLAAKSVKISGTIAGADKLGKNVKIGLQTLRDKEVITTTIAPTGAYEFENVPVAATGAMPVFLAEAGAKYNAAYGVDVPYNYGLTPNYISVYPDAEEVEQDLTVKKIGCNVSGTVTGVKSGDVTLTKDGKYVDDTKLMPTGTYTFQGVAAGNYTATFECFGYETKNVDITVAEELEDVTVPAITLTATAATITVSGNVGAYNGSTYEYFDGAKLEIWNAANTEKLAETTIPAESYGYLPNDFTFTGSIGDKVIFKMTHPSIKPVSKEYTVNGSSLHIAGIDLNYEFVNEGDDWVVPTNFKAAWNADSKLALSWAWPANATDAKIKRIELKRKLTNEASTEFKLLQSWDAASGSTFTANELPVEFTDTVTQALSYAYMFDIRYANGAHDVTFIADMRDGAKYTLTYTVNDATMGTVTSDQPEGEYMEGDMITVTATAKSGYKFVKFLINDKELAEDATVTLIGDTVAIYGFQMPAENVTLKAVFEVKLANEKLESAKWTIFAEDGAIVIKGINGDRYDIFDLNGRLAGHALCTGTVVRVSVTPSRLYIVRRLGADGSFDAKKIVVR